MRRDLGSRPHNGMRGQDCAEIRPGVKTDEQARYLRRETGVHASSKRLPCLTT